jgi:hypothetical protein
MPLNKRIITLALVLILGLLLQAGFVAIDCKDTPHGSAVAFAKAYYKLDPNMACWICEDQLNAGEDNIVEQYLYGVKTETAKRGFDNKFAKYMLYHIKTKTDYKSDTEAVVHLTARRRMAINPVFAYVAGIFHLGETSEFDESLQVVFKDGRWKVCGNLFDLPTAS